MATDPGCLRDSHVVSSDENGECRVTLSSQDYQKETKEDEQPQTASRERKKLHTHSHDYQGLTGKRIGLLIRSSERSEKAVTGLLGIKQDCFEIDENCDIKNSENRVSSNPQELSFQNYSREEADETYNENNSETNCCEPSDSKLMLTTAASDIMVESEKEPQIEGGNYILSKCLNKSTRSASNFDTKERLDDSDSPVYSPLSCNSPGRIKFDTSIRYESQNGGPPKYNVKKIKQAKKEFRRPMKSSRTPSSSGRMCRLKYSERRNKPLNESVSVKFDRPSDECRIQMMSDTRSLAEKENSSDDSLNGTHCSIRKANLRKRSVDEKFPPHPKLDVLNMKKYRPKFAPSENIEIREESEESEDSYGVGSTDDSKESRDSSFKFRHRYRSFESDHEDEHDNTDYFQENIPEEQNCEKEIEENILFKNNDSTGDSESSSDVNSVNSRGRGVNRTYDKQDKDCAAEEANVLNDKDDNRDAGTLDDLSSLAKDDPSATLLKPPKSGVSRVSTMETLNPHVNR